MFPRKPCFVWRLFPRAPRPESGSAEAEVGALVGLGLELLGPVEQVLGRLALTEGA